MKTIWVILFFLFVGCANNDEPRLDEFVNDLYQPRTVTNYQISGKRDGATTQVFIMYQLENDERLQLTQEGKNREILLFVELQKL